MEKWFKRAVAADPDATLAFTYPEERDAYDWKLEYLQPRWYGSNEEVLQFGRECLATRNWEGRVTWVLVTAHGELARTARAAGVSAEQYYHNPEVWRDIEEVAGGWMRIRPQDASAASDYAYWAWKCGQGAGADRQFRQLGARLNPSRFGGTDGAENAKAEAARRAAEPPESR